MNIHCNVYSTRTSLRISCAFNNNLASAPTPAPVPASAPAPERAHAHEHAHAPTPLPQFVLSGKLTFTLPRDTLPCRFKPSGTRSSSTAQSSGMAPPQTRLSSTTRESLRRVSIRVSGSSTDSLLTCTATRENGLLPALTVGCVIPLPACAPASRGTQTRIATPKALLLCRGGGYYSRAVRGAGGLGWRLGGGRVEIYSVKRIVPPNTLAFLSFLKILFQLPGCK